MKNHYQMLKETIHVNINRVKDALCYFFSFYTKEEKTTSMELVIYNFKQQEPVRSKENCSFLNKAYVFIFCHQFKTQEEEGTPLAKGDETINQLRAEFEKIKREEAVREIANKAAAQREAQREIERERYKQEFAREVNEIRLGIGGLAYELTLINKSRYTPERALRLNSNLNRFFASVLSDEGKKQIARSFEEERANLNGNLHYR